MEVNDHEVQNLESRAHEAFVTIFSFIPTLVLKYALLLKIPDIIASTDHHASLSLHQITAQLATQNPHLSYLSRILGSLSARGVFLQSQSQVGEEDKYDLSETVKLLYVTENNPFSLVPFVLMQTNEVMQKPWHHFHECVLNGLPNI